MKILITNDDGIFAPGIRALAAWATKLGDVTVVAPKHEQSAKSHGINIIGEFEVKEVDFMPGVRAYSVDSTPADCIRYGIVGLGEQYDLVLSGINRGVNVGRDIVYSGTVAAIFEANCFGAKAAIAMSTEFTSLERAVPHLDEIWAYFEEHKLLERHDLYNVNIPEHYTESIRITRQGGAYFSDEFVSTGENMVRQSGRMVWQDERNFDLDSDAVMHGYISITPMTVQRTDMKVYEALESLNQ
jgi:5'-nucleotidase